MKSSTVASVSRGHGQRPNSFAMRASEASSISTMTMRGSGAAATTRARTMASKLDWAMPLVRRSASTSSNTHIENIATSAHVTRRAGSDPTCKLSVSKKPGLTGGIRIPVDRFQAANACRLGSVEIDNANAPVFGGQGVGRIGQFARPFADGCQARLGYAVMGQEGENGIGPLLAEFKVVIGAAPCVGVTFNREL